MILFVPQAPGGGLRPPRLRANDGAGAQRANAMKDYKCWATIARSPIALCLKATPLTDKDHQSIN